MRAKGLVRGLRKEIRNRHCGPCRVLEIKLRKHRKTLGADSRPNVNMVDCFYLFR